MAKVQRVPRAYIALLGMTGENPPGQAENSYRPTIEMIDYIQAELPATQPTANNAAAVTGSNATVTVPQGEVWIVVGVNAVIPATSGAVQNILQLAIGVGGLFVPVARSWWTGDRNIAAPDANYAHNVFWFPPVPTILKAGDGLRAILVATDAGAAQSLTIATTIRLIRV